ncbi:2-amino-4-hydroxy-6-hydroxymethyldihydropteridine diphosphokinase [Sphingomonas glacialis]|uniref:2-amino-4-hydroxy-6-hydroxymethyldihydropteridine pyrophosphokinase n=1 Tax=Sphingomonas glacialis TaxID=658225 RepID=A0A502FTX4_9SPHN|nr:2-amino-4-hydroxy-6-hydroxymethyldihydropteridine diphosphokinase [Sphingomonas glacialis]TPG52839.1 2-amino-4-hydroxy-6-hydroxymethyldihydropteridine diphosphokinase [Sphingomonas glacialis]
MSNSTCTPRYAPRYAIAIGSNRRGRHGSPAAEVAAAIAALGSVVAESSVLGSAPLGPSIRRFANAVVLIESEVPPPEMLVRLKRIERAFGRRRGARWGARVIDLDIVSWSGGAWRSKGLCVPHLAFQDRDFVLAPLRAIAPDWRDPRTGLTPRQLLARLRKGKRLG